jgi:hypothetical protein
VKSEYGKTGELMVGGLSEERIWEDWGVNGGWAE